MSEKSLTFTQKRIIDHFSSSLSIDDARGLTTGDLIRLLRKRLHMTQGQLAKRAGVPQSFISRIETGGQEPSLKTLRKLYEVLSCKLIVVPVASENFDEVLMKQARKYVRKNLEYIKGTMSLEKQLPDPGFIDDLLEEESKKLIFAGDTRIWDVS